MSVRIQHHPSRVALAGRLARGLHQFRDIEIVADPEPDGRPDAWRSFRPCLESMSPAASHLLIAQDDAVPLRGFRNRLLDAIEEYRDHVLLAFTPGFPRERKLLAEASRAGARYAPFTVGSYVPTVCTVYPRAFVEGLLDWADAGDDGYRRPMRGADDGILAHYCRRRRIQPLALVPCIADHDMRQPSIGKAHRLGPHRRAALI